uniref:Uncharacterized protein n=1 Tax=Candidatus Kentrum eta TaxID=2126337 RepID=A0A450UT51_9GAMM|nr:MAG: hypothetical protein BECKH772A_GA0070896_100036 [Candidatus Kentron sp. H]VFJ88960.1 MAG: hypothetical protein BECKH772B_GA0070898_100036 [Candidatus Kentron sp. H]VFJ95699.1 MAG: hypothetical protein BECKH772C_GA0070978_100036 [Candidatus Kentron sp. H]
MWFHGIDGGISGIVVSIWGIFISNPGIHAFISGFDGWNPEIDPSILEIVPSISGFQPSNPEIEPAGSQPLSPIPYSDTPFTDFATHSPDLKGLAAIPQGSPIQPSHRKELSS